MNAKTNEEHIEIKNVRNNVKTLGVCVSPSLSWKDEF